MKKRIFPTELAYACGIVFLALGVVFMEKADFGMSMVVVPAYLIYRALSPIWPVVTFGMAEYCFQALLLIAMCIVLRKFRLSWLFSFVTAVTYGLVLDGCMLLLAALPAEGWGLRLAWYVIGMLLCSMGVSMMFHTYIAPEVYELFVKEVSGRFGKNIHRFKTAYDCTSCLLGVILSFAFFGMWHFEGVIPGTIVCALLNGWLIGRCSWIYEKIFDFQDRLSLRKIFA